MLETDNYILYNTVFIKSLLKLNHFISAFNFY
jgi:hypothetical protein